MKLEMTLPEKPGFMHAIPAFNLLALLFLLYSMGPLLMMQSGITVTLPPSQFQLNRLKNHIVITLGAADTPNSIYLNREAISFEQLSDRLESLRDETSSTDSLILLRSDQLAPVVLERSVTELVLKKGFKLALVGKDQAPAPKPK